MKALYVCLIIVGLLVVTVYGREEEGECQLLENRINKLENKLLELCGYVGVDDDDRNDVRIAGELVSLTAYVLHIRSGLLILFACVCFGSIFVSFLLN